MSCIFCMISQNQIPSKTIYEDEFIKAFYDIEPKAPVHFLIIPKTHIDSVGSIDDTNSDIVAYLFKKIPQIAKELGLDGGYRVVSNCGDDAGQSVKHLHFHILGGAKLSLEMA